MAPTWDRLPFPGQDDQADKTEQDRFDKIEAAFTVHKDIELPVGKDFPEHSWCKQFTIPDEKLLGTIMALEPDDPVLKHLEHWKHRINREEWEFATNSIRKAIKDSDFKQHFAEVSMPADTAQLADALEELTPPTVLRSAWEVILVHPALDNFPLNRWDAFSLLAKVNFWPAVRGTLMLQSSNAPSNITLRVEDEKNGTYYRYSPISDFQIMERGEVGGTLVLWGEFDSGIKDKDHEKALLVTYVYTRFLQVTQPKEDHYTICLWLSKSGVLRAVRLTVFWSKPSSNESKSKTGSIHRWDFIASPSSHTALKLLRILHVILRPQHGYDKSNQNFKDVKYAHDVFQPLASRTAAYLATRSKTPATSNSRKRRRGRSSGRSDGESRGSGGPGSAGGGGWGAPPGSGDGGSRTSGTGGRNPGADDDDVPDGQHGPAHDDTSSTQQCETLRHLGLTFFSSPQNWHPANRSTSAPKLGRIFNRGMDIDSLDPAPKVFVYCLKGSIETGWTHVADEIAERQRRCGVLPCALIKLESGKQPIAAAKFASQKEIEALTRLQHLPGVVKIRSVHCTKTDNSLLVTKFAGTPLVEYCHSHTYASPPPLVVLMQLLDTVQQVHGAGYAHLDIKPDNVAVRQNPVDHELPVATILDFGHAHRIADGLPDTVYGTDGWVAPEADTKISEGVSLVLSDTWSLGRLLCFVAAEYEGMDGKQRAGILRAGRDMSAPEPDRRISIAGAKKALRDL